MLLPVSPPHCGVGFFFEGCKQLRRIDFSLFFLFIFLQGLVVPSNVAQLHWFDILHSNNTSTTTDTPNVPMIHVVQPGAATAAMATKTRNTNRTVVAYLGRLDRIKSPSIFIRLVASLMQEEHQWQVPYEFWVIGAGNLKATLQEMLHALMMLPSKNRYANNPTLSASTFSSFDGSIDRFISNRITFMGAISHSTLISLLKHDIDIVVHSTLSNETFGLSNVEAMALGVPVISTCVGGVADYLRHNMSHGACVPSTTSTTALIDEMKQEVYRLGSLTDVDWNKTSRAAIEYVQSYGLRKRDMIHRYHLLYSGLVSK
jgi:glycosyltransferase involved in cell wall biosynthesis